MDGHTMRRVRTDRRRWENIFRFRTYNKRNRINVGLESVLRGTENSNMDLGVFQDTKFTNEIHMCASVGYHILTSDVPIRH